MSRGVEGIQDCGTVVDGAKHDGVCLRSDGNTRGIVPNPPCQEVEPGDHIGEPRVSRDIEGDWSHKSDGDGIRYNGRRDGKDGATSGTRCNSQ